MQRGKRFLFLMPAWAKAVITQSHTSQGWLPDSLPSCKTKLISCQPPHQISYSVRSLNGTFWLAYFILASLKDGEKETFVVSGRPFFPAQPACRSEARSGTCRFFWSQAPSGLICIRPNE
ncbi:hypothetical protein TEQG_01061 [Trichophyton equinum CBS 127.97]|uniref:Uncharacterized protein n=1 Tax=Trichophyton equinum (strain ATCC MYA-4606 / CBS 127.97) TaxID=559882 RepID=F2PJF4_TRIEC|nr:hypothetical protein TEQG_01061 [Trichophyton equinum CBS 127.97]